MNGILPSIIHSVQKMSCTHFIAGNNIASTNISFITDKYIIIIYNNTYEVQIACSYVPLSVAAGSFLPMLGFVRSRISSDSDCNCSWLSFNHVPAHAWMHRHIYA